MSLITRGAVSALVLAAACGGSSSTSSMTAVPSPAAPAAGGPPMLLGRPIWDRPLSDPMALRALERVRTALADKPPALQGTDPRMWLGPIQGWIEDRVRLTREVRADADALGSDADPRMQLLASVVLGVAADDFVSDLLSIEPPAEFVAGEHGAQTKTVFKETIERQAAPLSSAARVMLQKCVVAAPRAPAQLRQWEAYCRQRDASLGELEARVAARETASPRTPQSKPPALFADCDTKEVRHVDPDAPPPDLKAKPAVVYLYTSSDLKDEDARKLEQAVAAKLGLEVGMPVVNEKEVAAARALVAQKRMHARAPVCGQPPPLPAVLAHKRRHLIIGEIQTTCIWHDKTERCGLLVQYVRAGSDDNSGVPPALFAKVTSRDVPAAEWFASVERLIPDAGVASILGSLGMGKESKIFFELANYRDDAPWLRVASTLDSDTQARLSACIDAPASFDATFTISPVGKTQKTTLAPVTAPPAGSTVDTCVKKALEATAWPCPLDGKPAKVAVRLCVAPRPE